MSAPIPDYDQLLSDHLDGRLDAVQLQMLEQRLREDPALQSRLDALQSDRHALRKMFASVPAPPALPTDFAARVLAESRRRGLATNSTPECVSLETSKSRVRLRLIVGVLITAASLLIVVSLSQIGRTPKDAVSTLAQNQPPSDSLGSDSIAQDQAGVEPLIAATERETQLTAPADSMTSSSNDILMNISPKPSLDAVASADREPHEGAAMTGKQSPTVSMADDDEAELFNAAFTVAMMVYDVRLTSEGRERAAVTRAIQRNGLGDSHRQPINRDVIAAAKQANTFDEDAKYQVIYLQGPAKKIDRVFLDLLKDRQEVESVSLTLVTDMPLLQIAGRAVHIDATQIEHDRPLSLELGGNDNDAELETLRELLGDQVFMPLGAPDAADQPSGSDTLSSSGNDVITRVLILVR